MFVNIILSDLTPPYFQEVLKSDECSLAKSTPFPNSTRTTAAIARNQRGKRRGGNKGGYVRIARKRTRRRERGKVKILDPITY